MTTKIIAVVGMPGAGKSEAVKFLIEKGYYRVYFGDITFNRMKELGIEINAKNEQTTRESIRKEHGMNAYAKLSLPEIEKGLRSNGKVVVESMYSFEEYKLLKAKFGNEFAVLTVMAPPSTRYERLGKRTVRRFTREECEQRDISQLDNLHQGGPIAMADFIVINEGTIADLVGSMENIIQRIK